MSKKNIPNVMLERMLRDVVSEAEKSAESVCLLAETYGEELPKLEFTRCGLLDAERVYRRLCNLEKFREDLNREVFEDVMAKFLGQTLVVCYGAEWRAYKGRFYTLKPIVVYFSEIKKSLDVFAPCVDLIDAKSMTGARQGQALASFFDNALRNALL